MGFFLTGCGTPALEDLVGKISEPLNQKSGAVNISIAKTCTRI